jgi:hypothetical protein
MYIEREREYPISDIRYPISDIHTERVLFRTLTEEIDGHHPAISDIYASNLYDLSVDTALHVHIQTHIHIHMCVCVCVCVCACTCMYKNSYRRGRLS